MVSCLLTSSARTGCGSRRIPSANFRPGNSIAFAIHSRPSAFKSTCPCGVDCRCGIRDLTDRFVERGLHVVNGLVQDIRKSTLHAHLEAIGLPSLKAAPSGSSDEILFVKTDLNYGGELERWLSPESIAAGHLGHLISPDIRGAYDYKIVERGMLREDLWTDPAIVVETVRHQRRELVLSHVYFSGKQIIIVKVFAPGIIKKLSDDPRDTNFVTDLESPQGGDGRTTDQRDVEAGRRHVRENTRRWSSAASTSCMTVTTSTTSSTST